MKRNSGFLDNSSDDEDVLQASKLTLHSKSILNRISHASSNSQQASLKEHQAALATNVTSTPVQKSKQSSKIASFIDDIDDDSITALGRSLDAPSNNDKENTSPLSGSQSQQRRTNSADAFTSGSEEETSFNTENKQDNSFSQDMKEIKEMMGVLVKQNKELLNRVNVLEEQSSKKKKSDVIVPNDVRYKVRQAYDERKNQGKSLWKFDENPGPFSECNKEVTNYIRAFVCGLYPNLENRDTVVNRAIKTYYESNVTAIRRKQRNPNKAKELAKNQRKIHKAERRKKALANQVTKFERDVKEDLVKAIVPEMMSSEDECEDDNGRRYFLIRKPNFRTKRYEKLIRVIDDAYHRNSSKRSKDQFIERRVGENSSCNPPKSLAFGYNLFIKNDV